MPRNTRKSTFSFVSLGCAKNLVDSERMLGLLAQAGYVPTPDPRDADLVIVNTCGFIEQARQESLDWIRDLAAWKQQRPGRRLVVAGCLAQRQRRRLLRAVPQIDAVVGVFAREAIVAVCDRLRQRDGQRQAVFEPLGQPLAPETARLRVTPRHLAYLKIAEGCDHRCTFCSIPLMRGPQRSKPLEALLAEAAELARDGVRELCLVAQDTTAYGIDLYGQPRLADLLVRLDRMAGFRWIRLLYAHPRHVTDELIAVMADSAAIVPYIDLPLQHINDRLLRRMGRRITRAQTEALLAKLRARLPGLAIRTTLLVGFPGETEAQFRELVEFVRQARFERLGAFAYSREPDTPSARMAGLLPEAVRQARLDELMRTQQEIAFEHNRQMVGRSVELLIDGRADRPRTWQARSPTHAPEIDGGVFLVGGRLRPGRFVTATITRAEGYDLWASAAPPTGRAGHAPGAGAPQPSGPAAG